jgi:ApaG protein
VYHITIENHGSHEVQLTNRHWVITNGHGQIEEVRGVGVVGVQPRISPGETFHYSSACPLDTPVGSMRGSYRMVKEDGSHFDAQIESFTLVAPHSLN